MTEIPSTLRTAIYSHRRKLVFAAYAAIATGSFALSYVARFDVRWPSDYASTFLRALPLLVAIRLLTKWAFGISTSSWRYVSTRDVLRLAGATVSGTGTFLVLSRLLPFDPPVPLSIIAIECILTGYFTGAVWLAYRFGYEGLLQRNRRVGNGASKRVLIVGAGEAGNMLAREIVRFPTGLSAVGFVDDDSAKWGTTVHGVEVIGATWDLESIVRSEKVEELILAIPSASPVEMRRVVGLCEGLGVTYKILPGIREVLEGEVGLHQLREVQIEDLLGRDPIQLELPELAEDLHDNVILITGATGSIGYELSRQAALHRPASLVLFDQAETPLFYLGKELREQYPALEIVTLVGDITDRAAVQEVFRRYGPDRVYHAAAYKHVGMMEDRPREAVRNNVCGTMYVAEAAGQYKAGKFVLVSTDKAVNPTNVMGASKRLAELVVLEIQARHPGTAFSAVRFGNVLGSQGSVIPIFKRQLRDGKPLTVTDPEATRYFMTIPEAVQLILQSSLLAETRGQITLLDMGEPVRIMDLAENLLRLSGIKANGNSIVVTGLQPGEKLHEELVGPEEETLPTHLEKVRIVAQRDGRSVAVLERAVRWAADCEEAHVLAEVGECFPSLQVPVHRPRKLFLAQA